MTPVIGPNDRIDWMKLDYVAAFNGKFHGTIQELTADIVGGGFLGRPLRDVAKVTVEHNKQIYLCDPQELVECTLVTMTTPWGLDRYVPRLSHW